MLHHWYNYRNIRLSNRIQQRLRELILHFGPEAEIAPGLTLRNLYLRMTDCYNWGIRRQRDLAEIHQHRRDLQALEKELYRVTSQLRDK